MMDFVAPDHGPATGNTTVAAHAYEGVRWEALGDVRCRFGELQPLVDGALVHDPTASRVLCKSPPYWRPSEVTPERSVPFEVTLNGQDYLQVLRGQYFIKEFKYQALGWPEGSWACVWDLETCQDHRSS